MSGVGTGAGWSDTLPECRRCGGRFALAEGRQWAEFFGVPREFVACPRCGAVYQLAGAPPRVWLGDDVSAWFPVGGRQAPADPGPQAWPADRPASRRAMAVIAAALVVGVVATTVAGGVSLRAAADRAQTVATRSPRPPRTQVAVVETPAPTPTVAATPSATRGPTPAGMAGPGSFFEEGWLLDARWWHTATSLDDGRVLIAGGQAASGESLAAAEAYQPDTRSFVPVGSMTTPRSHHAAVALRDGRVLVVGGTTDGKNATPTAELYDPLTDTFAKARSMRYARWAPSAIRLDDGRVLVVGGMPGQAPRAEVYDPAAGRFAVLKSAPIASTGMAVAQLGDGRVLLAGGLLADGTETERANVFDPATDEFSAGPALETPRAWGSAVRMESGEVLVVCGTSDGIPVEPPEVWQPSGSVPTRPLARPHRSCGATLLEDGRVLVVGGAPSDRWAELYDPEWRAFSAPIPLLYEHEGHAITLMLNGRVLVTGSTIGGAPSPGAEVYVP